MTLKELIESANPKRIVDKITYYWSSQIGNIDGYLSVIKELETLEPEPNNIILKAEKVTEEDSTEWIHVYGVEDGVSYSVSLVSWSMWLGMEISSDLLSNDSDLDIYDVLAGALFDMTFFGFSEKDREKAMNYF